jgi:hypothetical protein
MEQRLVPAIDHTVLFRAVEVDAAIRKWKSPQPQNSFSDILNLLHKQILWIYLWLTIYPLKSTSWVPEHRITLAVKDGIALLELFPPKEPVQALLLVPVFIIGCGAFDTIQRDSVRGSLQIIEKHAMLKDTDLALIILECL